MPAFHHPFLSLKLCNLHSIKLANREIFKGLNCSVKQCDETGALMFVFETSNESHDGLGVRLGFFVRGINEHQNAVIVNGVCRFTVDHRTLQMLSSITTFYVELFRD